MNPGFDFIGVSVIFFCHDGQGNIVLHKRSKNCRDEHGNWDCGGGKLEFGHTVIDTLKKEVREEWCTDVMDYEFLGYRDVHRIHNGKKTHWLALDFKVLVDRDKVQIGEPHKFDDFGWFAPDNLPMPQHSEFTKGFEMHKDKIF